jgi:hypothetical protein
MQQFHKFIISRLCVAQHDNLPDHDQQRSNRHSPTVKTEVPCAVVRS